MIICNCFEGDNLEIARAQHDLYFGSNLNQDLLMPMELSTLGYLWHVATVLAQNEALGGGDPWFAAHYRRLKRTERFSHKALQVPHEHIAAYYRWIMRHTGRLLFREHIPGNARKFWIKAWREYLCWELPALLAEPGVLLTLCKTILYRQFDYSDKHAAELDRLLIKRYGMECVAQTWRTDPKMCRLMGVAA